MTDKLGSYTFTFYTAGVILIVGASITSFMACVKQQPEDAEELLETPSYGEKLLVTEKVTAVWALSCNWRRDWPSNYDGEYSVPQFIRINMYFLFYGAARCHNNWHVENWTWGASPPPPLPAII